MHIFFGHIVYIINTNDHKIFEDSFYNFRSLELLIEDATAVPYAHTHTHTPKSKKYYTNYTKTNPPSLHQWLTTIMSLCQYELRKKCISWACDHSFFLNFYVCIFGDKKILVMDTCSECGGSGLKKTWTKAKLNTFSSSPPKKQQQTTRTKSLYCWV